MSEYLDKVRNHLIGLLRDLPTEEERREAMVECVKLGWNHGYLNSYPREENPEIFSADLFADSSMRLLVSWDVDKKLAISAESPGELVMNLMPSDGHLD